jgi:predicted ATP-grasp superfamily ATP-dependent carboligase
VTEVAIGTIFECGLDTRLSIAAPPRAAYAVAIDKLVLGEHAARAGLDVPRTAALENAAAFSALPPGFAFPVIVKARRSRWLENGAWRRGGVHFVRHPAGLSALADARDLAGGAMVQEFIEGHGEGLFFLVQHGAVRATFAHRRLREKPPSGGESVLRESIAADPALVRASEALFAALGWNGIAMIEFRRASNGRAYVIELNPRLWGSLQLAVDAGIDFPMLIAELANGSPIAAQSARSGVRTRWLLGDVDHLWIALRNAAERHATGRTRGRVVLDFLDGFRDGSLPETWRRDDPAPFWRELALWMRG